MITIDYSGRKGINGQHGKDGQFYSQSGTNGQNAEDGQKGQDIDVFLSVEGQSNIIIKENNKNQVQRLNLGSQDNQVHLYSNGGEGGQGGDGGWGKHGDTGYSGINATRFTMGTNGGKGGPGGDGGNGGNGGNGGDAGSITAMANNQDMDLFMIIDNVSTKGGQPGEGGQGGKGGEGGMGGIGGCSYSWTETVNDQVRVYTNPGGVAGPPGEDGKDGNKGFDGKQGQNGKFFYILDGRQYSQRYDLIVDNVCAVQSDDNIIEPGETLKINQMKFVNTGGMHTPTMQRIALYLQDNGWVQFKPSNTVYISQSLQAGEAFQITENSPLIFQIKDYTKPIIDQTFIGTAIIDYRARVERVNKEFQKVADKADSYIIRFPVEISLVQILRSIQYIEESPFAISLWNRSTKPIGIDHNRLLNFRLIQRNSQKKVDFQPKFFPDQNKDLRNSSEWGQKARDQQYFQNPQMNENNYPILEQDFITSLAPNEKKIISGTIKFNDPNLDLYTKIDLQAKLDLGFYHRKDNQFQNIITRNFQIQLAEGYSYDSKSEFLLIVNSETSKQLINEFKQFAKQIGTQIDIWNISNQQGFSYNHIPYIIGQPFSDLYQNKIIIILSNDYTKIDNKKTNAVKEIREPHIYKGIKDYNIPTYIIGPSYNYNEFWLLHPNCDPQESKNVGLMEEQLYQKFTSNQALPQKQKDKKEEDQEDNEENKSENKSEDNHLNNHSYKYDYFKDIICCSQPQEEKMISKAQSILKKIDQLNPQYCHTLTYTYEPTLLKKNTFSDKFYLGQISVIESLRKDCASFIMNNKQDMNSLDDFDKYNMIKLLTFEKKLFYLKRNILNIDFAKIFMKAIVSDLCDEYIAYQQQNLNTEQLHSTLQMWKLFQEYNFISLFQVDQSDIFEKSFLADFSDQQSQKNGSFCENIPEGNQKVMNQQQQVFEENKKEINILEYLDENQPNSLNDDQHSLKSSNSEHQKKVDNLNQLKYYFIDNLIQFKIALKKQISLMQKCCCLATFKVNSHCQFILETVLLKKLQTNEKIIDEFSQKFCKQNENKQKYTIFKQFQNPYQTSSPECFIKIYSTRDFPNFSKIRWSTYRMSLLYLQIKAIKKQAIAKDQIKSINLNLKLNFNEVKQKLYIQQLSAIQPHKYSVFLQIRSQTKKQF